MNTIKNIFWFYQGEETPIDPNNRSVKYDLYKIPPKSICVLKTSIDMKNGIVYTKINEKPKMIFLISH